MYYQIGEEHKEFCAEKTQDEGLLCADTGGYRKEQDGKGMNQAKVHIAAGLRLTWVATQKEDFQKYLLQNESVILYSAIKSIMWSLQVLNLPTGICSSFLPFTGFQRNQHACGYWKRTMNIMYINNSRPLEKKCFTEKYGTHQCVLAVRESLLKELGTVVDDLVIEQVIRTGQQILVRNI